MSASQPSATLPDRARVVIIGGGVIGTSIAYHLAHLGWTDVVVCERDRLTSGTTWHAAGLMVTFGSFSQTATEIRLYTRDLYARLETETGLATGFNPIGFVELAADRDRLEEYRRVAVFNRLFGVEVEEISPDEVSELFPLARTDDLLAGFHVPGDGKVTPADVTMSLAAGARRLGVRILEQTPVTEVLQSDGVVVGVRTPRGGIESEYVVNCAGMWARQLGAASGVSIPLQAAEHYYLVTGQIPALSASWPVIEDPASYGYYREETGGLMIGLFEPVSAPWKVEGIPEGFSFGEITPDYDRMAPYVEKAMARVPVSAEAGIRKFFCGPESFTPDLQPVVGEAPELRNYFVAAGLNSIGILSAGGIGRVVAQWIVDGAPDVDVTGFNIDRLQPYQTDPTYLAARIAETLGMVYQAHYPTRTPQTGRDIFLSPLHERLQAAGAYFREVSGWESPDWYAPPGVTPEITTWSWGWEPWFEYWREEHIAARQGVVVMDMSFMSKFRVEGPDAGTFLQYLSANRVDGDPGVVTYTQWLNDDGGIEADLTITKLAGDRFWVVASDTAHRHVETWMRRRIGNRRAAITDETGSYAQINVQGPHSRDVLSRVADVTGLEFRGAREVEIAGVPLLCIRITYVGELGYELYPRAEDAVQVYDALVAAGGSLGVRHAGLRALSSLRMEKAYRDYGHDIDNTDTVYEAGLGFVVDFGHDFVGRDAVEKLPRQPQRRLVQVLVTDPGPLMYHGEVLYRDGASLGHVRSASYGFTLGGAVGLAVVEADQPVNQEYLDGGTWEVDVAGFRYPAVVSVRPLYDPESRRVK